MAVFRIDKTKNYTVMANHHLQNKELSLKAKGLLSVMLSLPERWDYTTKGLSTLCKDGVDSINGAIKELEQQGYIVRCRVRNAKGQLTTIEYTIREQPQTQEVCLPAEKNEVKPPTKPKREKPILDFPILDNPILGKPVLENPVQLNTKVINTKRESKNQSNPYLSAQTVDRWDDDRCSTPEPVCMGCRDVGCDSIEEVEELVKFSIEYDHFAKKPVVAERVTEIVDLLVEVFASSQPTMAIGKETYPAMFVKNRLRKLNGIHIEYVLDCLDHNANPIRNIKRYLLTALFNAPSTVDNYYATMVSRF